MVKINNDWDELLAEEFQKEYYSKLREFLKEAYSAETVYPHMDDIFNAFKFTPYKDVKVVIVGQDPYIRENEAHGLSFSVGLQTKTPPSLANIFKELSSDLGCTVPNNGHLVHWAKQGVLLLNAVMTVYAGRSRSHAGKGWEVFTDAVMEKLNEHETPIVFLLWGKDAHVKGRKITNPAHLILQAAHPSPLAGGKFFGSKPFSQANAFLEENNLGAIDWQIPNKE